MATFGSGPEGGKAIVAPTYRKYIDKKTLYLLANQSQQFQRVTGPHRIIMSIVGSPNLSWAFSLTGGTNSTSGEGLPMFPRDPKKLYNPSINYKINGDDLPAYGCVITTLPVPPQSAMTTRVNMFQVTETVTGSNFSFVISECPYAHVDPTIVSTLNVDVDMKIIFYRAKADNYRSLGWSESRGAPVFKAYNFPTDFISNAGVNPLDSMTALPFQRISGQQTIVVYNKSTHAYFSFDVDYGIIGQGGGYLGYVSPTANAKLASKDIENATLSSITGLSNPNAVIRKEMFTLVASDGRTYEFVFDPSGYNQIPPTIRLSAGPLLGAESISVNVFARYFKTL